MPTPIQSISILDLHPPIFLDSNLHEMKLKMCLSNIYNITLQTMGQNGMDSGNQHYYSASCPDLHFPPIFFTV